MGYRRNRNKGAARTEQRRNSARGFAAVPGIIHGPRADSGGQRHTELVKYASSLRARSVPYTEAKTLYKAVWERCEQPPDCLRPMPWEDGLAKLDDVYGRCPEGPSEEYRRDRDGDPSRDAGRPHVDVCNVAHAAEWLRDELGRGELAGIFRRDNELVHTPRMGEEGYLPPVEPALGMPVPRRCGQSPSSESSPSSRPATTAGRRSRSEKVGRAPG